MNAKNKIALAISTCWLVFFLIIMWTQIVSDSTPAVYLFRTFFVGFGTPLLFLWITDTLKYVIAWFKD